MLTKGRAKSIQQLQEKKYRNEKGLFVVEGEKSVVELLQSDFKLDALFITAYFKQKYLQLLNTSQVAWELVEQKEIENMGTLETNNAALAIAKQKPATSLSVGSGELVLALDTIRDPGNLGTIIRIADWYGIKKIIASATTTDFYNSKTISATMGSFTRVQMMYTNLEEFLKETSLPILGAFLNGTSVHTYKFPKEGILVMGNESNGISSEISAIIKEKITIPAFGKAESLNASVATAVILDNWKRNLL
jgi:TrmH family RNA methyltransferase